MNEMDNVARNHFFKKSNNYALWTEPKGVITETNHLFNSSKTTWKY